MVLTQDTDTVKYKPRVDEFFIYVQQSEPTYRTKKNVMLIRDDYKQRLLELVFSYMFTPNQLFEMAIAFRPIEIGNDEDKNHNGKDEDLISEGILEKIVESGFEIPNGSYQLILTVKPVDNIEDPELQAKLRDFEGYVRKEYNMVRIGDEKKE